MIDILETTFYKLLDSVNLGTYRYLYHQFAPKGRLTGIIGPRGVGKTTLLLQYIKHNYPDTQKVFYFSADNIYFSKTTLFDFVFETNQHRKTTTYFIDEIHKYKNWNQELKNIYDSFPDINIIFSGSSSIDLIKGSYDLSRRAKLYHLEGLSFREYINFKNHTTYESVSFETLLSRNPTLNQTFSTIEGIKGEFIDYLKYGYYPFVFEDKTSYYERIEQIIDKTIYEDIANFYSLKTENLHYLKKILNYLTTISPGEVSTHNLANNLSINDRTAFHYLTMLSEVGLVRFVYPHAQGGKLLRKPAKVFVNNTTLCHAINKQLAQPIDKGTLRELFFVQMLQNAGILLNYSTIGDYEALNTVFEIGGKNKKRKQLQKTSKNTFLVKDDILTSQPGTLPLYFLGFLY